MHKSMEEINSLESLLKPCPFCGGKARIYDATRHDGYCSYRVKFVQCIECHAKTEEKTWTNIMGITAQTKKLQTYGIGEPNKNGL